MVPCFMYRASLVAERIKHLPAMQETQVQSLGWEDPLEKEMATHSSILAWRIPWTEEPGGLQPTGSQELDTTERHCVCVFYVQWLVSVNPNLTICPSPSPSPLW